MKTFIIKRKRVLSKENDALLESYGRTTSMTDAKNNMRALGFKPSTYVIEEMTPEAVAVAEHTIFVQPGFAESRQIIFGRAYFRK